MASKSFFRYASFDPQPMQPYYVNQAAMHIVPIPVFPERKEPIKVECHFMTKKKSRMSFCSRTNTAQKKPVNIYVLTKYQNRGYLQESLVRDKFYSLEAS